MLVTAFYWVVIIWGSLSILLVLGAMIAGLIILRRVQASAHRASDSVKAPLNKVKEGLAFVRGATKGAGEAVDILRGHERKDGHDEDKDKE